MTLFTIKELHGLRNGIYDSGGWIRLLRIMGVARICYFFWGGGGNTFKKLSKNIVQNLQKIFQNFEKNYKKFVKKIAKNGFLAYF